MDIESVVDDVFRQIRFNVTSPYALFGHSFGGLISYLLLEKLKSNNCPLPLHLFVSGRGAPSQPLWDIPYHTLSKKDLIWKLKELDGSPAEVLENAELFDFFEPILRADFQAIETYRYHPTRPYDLPITIFVGKEEGREERDVLGWQIETIQRISIHEMDGKHFFIFDKGKEMVDIMTRCLRPVTASR
jgi:surfactin synthase thioesterase subunit